jgi:hypothetical protein
MIRVVAVVLVLACGCTQTQARKAHRAGEVATAAGLIGVLVAGVVASLVPAHEDPIMTVGLTFVPISLVGALVYIATDSKVNREHSEPTLTRRERNRASAWELTKQAAGAARDKDCTQVQAIDPRVRNLDMEFHVSVFMRDAAIQRCLRAP